MTAGKTYDWHASHIPTRSVGSGCSHSNCSTPCCTRIHHLAALRSLMGAGRCLCQTLWTSSRSGSWMHHRRRYLSTQTRSACSCPTLAGLWTYCTRRSTSCWCCDVTVGQTSAYSGRSVSADWAGRCQASSCRSSRWNRLYTPPMNDWRH